MRQSAAMSRRLKSLARPLFWAALVFTLVMALVPAEPTVLAPVSDKVQHMAAFAILAGLGFLAYPRASKLRLLILLSLFGGVIELLQGLAFFHRDRDILDWVADTGAAAATLLILVAIPFVRLSKTDSEPL
jgi:hypothetical protein